ncbi:RICIN domain-containing protein [Kribbella sp. NPDC004536]|uniref:RICIN domain-containing protein n=1 Tax=Kribbella sp. NPDC004536 TaxID=3364106 RepID=UPI0036AA53BB
MKYVRLKIRIGALGAALAAAVAAIFAVGTGTAQAADNPYFLPLQFVHSNRCLHIIPNGYTDGNRAIQDDCVSTDTYGQFRFITIPGAGYQIQVYATGKCLSLESFTTADDARVAQRPCQITSPQIWQYRQIETNTFSLVNLWSGKCMDVEGAYTRRGARVWQYTCWGGTNQQFYARPDVTGVY